MGRDLNDMVTSFRYEVNPAGQILHPMTQTEAVGRLIDSFWELRLMGLDFLAGFTCDDNGVISPQANGPNGMTSYVPAAWYTDGDNDLGREVLQAIVLFAGYRMMLSNYQNLKTMVAAKAGSVSYETQQSAQVLQTVLKALTAKIDIVLTRLSDLGSTTVTVLDAVIDQTISLDEGTAWWTRGSYGGNSGDRW